TVWSWGATLNAAGERYLQSYFGVNDEQAARTGYPVYEPRAGLRDVSIATSWRSELSHDWLAIAGFGASRLLGPAAQSPLSKQLTTWGVSAGLAWRF
ncbi:MAG: MipA/OmpV family protein, partial [Rubrivivax sp.]